MSQREGATGFDVFSITPLGTGVAETELGTGIQTPTQARQINSVIPYGGATGAYTAAQGAVSQVELRSDSISSLSPKKIINHQGNGGVGAFIDVLMPILEEWKFYTPIQQQAFIRCFGTPQMANTVQFDQGCAIQYSTELSRMPEVYWNKPANETSTGTAAAKVAGDTIDIKGGNSISITDLWALAFVGGVVTVSESLYGFMEFQSSEFNDAMPLRVPVQPLAAGLNTITLHMAKLARYKCWKPAKGNTLINTSFTMEEAQTAAQVFLGGVGYIKTGQDSRRNDY